MVVTIVIIIKTGLQLLPMDAVTWASRYSAVLVERLWTMGEEERTKVGGSYPLTI